MLGVRLEPELEERLDWLAKQTGHTKSYHAKKAIKKYLEVILVVEIGHGREGTDSE